MYAMNYEVNHDMVAAHLQNLQVQNEPEEYVWVKPPPATMTAVDLLYPNKSWKSCIRSSHEEIYGRIPILCKADMHTAYELGKELVKDNDNNDYWLNLEIANMADEEEIMDELNRLENEEQKVIGMYGVQRSPSQG